MPNLKTQSESLQNHVPPQVQAVVNELFRYNTPETIHVALYQLLHCAVHSDEYAEISPGERANTVDVFWLLLHQLPVLYTFVSEDVKVLHRM